MGGSDDLRQRAEDALGLGLIAPPAIESPAALHESCTHQVELELQNEELAATRTELEASNQRYRDLFEEAPVGYVVLGKGGIIEANCRFAEILGARPELLEHQRLVGFVLPADAPAFCRFERTVLDSGRDAVELRLVSRLGAIHEVSLEGVCSTRADGVWRVAATDIGRSAKQATRALAHDCNRALMSVVTHAARARHEIFPGDPSQWALADVEHIAAHAARDITERLERMGAAERAAREMPFRPEQHSHSRLAECGGEAPTVLVVIDDPEVLRACQEAAWADGVRMLAARHTAEALTLLELARDQIAAVVLRGDAADELGRARADLPMVIVDDPGQVAAALRRAIVCS